MSTTSTPTTEPNPPIGSAPLQVETAPSQMMADIPTFTRIIGFAGLFFLVLGAVAVITNMYVGPRIVGPGMGYLLAFVGVGLMLFHAIRDGEQEVRRMYAMLAVAWLVLAVAAAVIPGPLSESGVLSKDKKSGYNLLPWGVGFGLLGLLFTIPFTRHETDEKYKAAAEQGLLWIGAGLALVSLLGPVLGDLFTWLRQYQIFRADFLIGPGIALALLGLAFLCAHLGQRDTSEGTGYWVAFTVGAAGAAVAIYAIGRAVVPTVLYEGPAVLRKPIGSLDTWRVVGRVLMILLFVGIGALAALRQLPNWLRITFAALGVIGAAVFVLGSFSSPVHTPPLPSLVPTGIVLVVLGTIYLAIALGICSDNQFIALTRRELAAYFLSPIGYLVLGGMVLAQWGAYWAFVDGLTESRRAVQEPIVRGYFVSLLTVFALVLQVPALTMRLMSEEKRSGSLEVLLTAPVNETPIVLSKFFATWLFFLITWLPAGLFLIALRVEVGQPFDYRPLLSFYVALAAQGVAFIGVGLFCSTMTKNQIVAAVLMFVVMVFLVACYLIKGSQTALGLPTFLQIVAGKMSFIDVWIEALSGRLPLRDTAIFISIGVFFLFLSVKVLEARKWN